MTTTATLPARTAPPEEECRRCRAARSLGRIALFVIGGLVFSLAISWVTARWPLVGVALSVIGIVLLVRSLVRLFTTSSPVQAATQLGLSLGVGALVSALAAAVATLAAR